MALTIYYYFHHYTPIGHIGMNGCNGIMRKVCSPHRDSFSYTDPPSSPATAGTRIG